MTDHDGPGDSGERPEPEPGLASPESSAQEMRGLRVRGQERCSHWTPAHISQTRDRGLGGSHWDSSHEFLNILICVKFVFVL